MSKQTKTAPPLADSALLGLVADIRAAVGDPAGKLMQDELVEHCRRMASVVEAAIQLNEIVEGVRNNQWVAGGLRLKDTPEWCAFYVSLNREIEQSNDQAQAPAGNNQTQHPK